MAVRRGPVNLLVRAAPLLLLFALGCTHVEAGDTKTSAPAPAPTAAAAAKGMERAGTPEAVSIAAARKKGASRSFTWRAWGPEAFAEAKRDRKLILLDGAAEWCHWCHV